MNVKTIKRISKRSVSMLLSVLMVLSLFTVCLVGTTVTASADNFRSITVVLKGEAAKWTAPYLVIGKDGYHSSFALQPVSGQASTWTYSGTWDGYTNYFISKNDAGNSGGITDAYNGIDEHEKTKLHGTNGSNLNLTGDYSEYERYGWVDATVWNYRTEDQRNDDYNNGPGSSGNTKTNIDIDRSNGMHSNWGEMKTYGRYNTAVADWYRTQRQITGKSNSTPLYQGNFRAGNDLTDARGTQDFVKGTFQYLFDYFVSVANGANRKNGSKGSSTSAVARYLVDSKLSNTSNPRNGTITQGGIELPQFSDEFMSRYNKRGNSSFEVEYTPKDDWSGTNSNASYNFGNIQSKYTDLKFAFNKSTTDAGNTKYSYDASRDGNRYLSTSTKKVKEADTVYSRYEDNQYKNPGYYPFTGWSSTDTSTIIDCFGTRFDIDFEMPSQNSKPSTGTGSDHGYQMKGPNGYEDLIFKFSGDDDVWVYIDGYLALDLGGSHNNASGEINLSKQTYKITSGYYDARYSKIGGDNKFNSSTSDSISTMSSSESLLRMKGFDNTEDASSETGKPLVDSLQDTSKTHTITVFYLERGTFDSNFAMEFMLPVVSDTSLSIDEKVDNSDVNTGLLSETLDSANKDIFSVNVKSNSETNNSSNNSTAALSKDTSFVRNDVVGTGNTKIQQGASNSKDGTTLGFGGSTSGFADVNAYYKWTDSATDDNTSTGEALATGDGVGVPSNGNVFLQYGQKAMFTDQFDVDTNLQLVPSTYLYNYGTTYDNDTGLLNIENKDKIDSQLAAAGQKKVADYYTTDIVVKDAKNQTLTPSGNTYDYANTGTTENKKAKVTATVTNKIKTTSFTVEKLLADGSENAKHKDDEFLFEIKASKIFGDKYEDDSKKPILKSVQPEFKIQETGKADIDGSYQLYKYNNDTKKYEIASAGTADAINAIKLKAGQKAVFNGIPVDSVFEVKEISSDTNLRVTIEDKTQDAVDAENVIKSKVETKSDDDKTAVVTVGTDVKSASAQVTNNFASTKIPVLYRYIDRNITSGQITVLEKHYTYYLKWIDGSDNAITSDNKVNEDYITQKIIPSSLNVDNLLYKYKLSTQQDSYKVVDLPTYRTDFDVNDPLRNDPIGHASEASEATAEGLQSCFDDIKANNYSDKIILAEYDKVQAKYSVRVYYPDSEEGSFVEKKVGPFTDKISYTAITPSKNPKDDDELARKFIYKVNGTDTECTFAYWERLITVRTGSKAESMWTPVTSNYTYSLAINDTTELRPVYYYTKEGKDYRVTYGENGTKPFTRLDTVYGEYPQFKTIDQNKYQYFHVTAKVVREYDANGKLISEETTPIENCWQVPITNDYNIKTQPANTYMEFTSEEKALEFVKELAKSKQYPTNFVEEHEPYDEFMNSYYNKNVGTDATVTDRTYDMYTKTTSNTDGTSKVESYTRINMIFGAAGSPDTDREITNIGYVLVKGSTGYESKTAEQLETLVGDGFTNRTDSATGIMIKSYTVNDWLTSSSDNYNSKPGAVNLTNKNRCQIVFDLKTSSQSYYTCYTFMVMQEKNADGTATGKKQIYISNTPANFRTSEAQQSIDTTETTVKKQFYVNLTSVASDENGNEISGKTALGKVETDQPIAVDGKKFTIKATPLTSGNKKGKLVRIDIGHMSIPRDKGTLGVELTDFQSGIGFYQPQLNLGNYINDQESSHTTTFDIKAYYAEVDNGVLASLPDNDNYNNYLNVVEIKDNNGNTYTSGQIIPYNGVQYVDVKVKVKSGVSRLISNVTGDGSGFSVVDGSMIATKRINITEQVSDEDFVEEMAKVSTSPAVIYKAPTLADRQSQHVQSITVSAIVGGAPIIYPGGDSSGNYSLIPDGTEITVTLVMEKGYKPSDTSIYNGSTSHTMTVTSENYVGENALKEALRPYSEEITYNVTIQVKSDQTSMGSASGTYNGGAGATSIVVKVKDSDEINLMATPSSGYKFDKWDISGNATITNQTSANTTATIKGNTTITASFASLAKKIYFAFVNQHYGAGDKIPRDTSSHKLSNVVNDSNSKYNWSSGPYIYMWKVDSSGNEISNSKNANWPGVNMTYEGVYKHNNENAVMYSYTITDTSAYNRAIFNGGDGQAQTPNLEIGSSYEDRVYYVTGNNDSGDKIHSNAIHYDTISNWTKQS